MGSLNWNVRPASSSRGRQPFKNLQERKFWRATVMHGHSGIAPENPTDCGRQDDEYEGHQQVGKAMIGMLPPLLDGMPRRTQNRTRDQPLSSKR
jgi:hypothetical protein